MIVRRNLAHSGSVCGKSDHIVERIREGIVELIVDRIKPPPEARFPAVYLPVTIRVEAA